MDREQVMAHLRAAPERLRATFAAAGAGAERRTPAHGEEWSAGEVLAHLRAMDVFLVSCVFVMAVVDSPSFPGGDERALAERAGYLEDGLATALHSFTCRRRELVRLLERLDEAGWQRASVHPAYGRFTIEDYARHFARHEAEHIGQIESALRIDGSSLTP